MSLLGAADPALAQGASGPERIACYLEAHGLDTSGSASTCQTTSCPAAAMQAFGQVFFPPSEAGGLCADVLSCVAQSCSCNDLKCYSGCMKLDPLGMCEGSIGAFSKCSAAACPDAITLEGSKCVVGKTVSTINACGSCGPLKVPLGTPCADGCGAAVCDQEGKGGLTCFEPEWCVDPCEEMDCSDGNPCTKDACDPKLAKCVHTTRADGTSCEDGVFCTAGDSCLDGACVAGSEIPCDDGNPCTIDTCLDETCGIELAADGADCSDGDPCVDPGLCILGVCEQGVPECGGTSNKAGCQRDARPCPRCNVDAAGELVPCSVDPISVDGEEAPPQCLPDAVACCAEGTNCDAAIDRCLPESPSEGECPCGTHFDPASGTCEQECWSDAECRVRTSAGELCGGPGGCVCTEKGRCALRPQLVVATDAGAGPALLRGPIVFGARGDTQDVYVGARRTDLEELRVEGSPGLMPGCAAGDDACAWASVREVVIAPVAEMSGSEETVPTPAVGGVALSLTLSECAGKTCSADGACGTCGGGLSCVDGACIVPPAADFCAGLPSASYCDDDTLVSCREGSLEAYKVCLGGCEAPFGPGASCVPLSWSLRFSGGGVSRDVLVVLDDAAEPPAVVHPDTASGTWSGTLELTQLGATLFEEGVEATVPVTRDVIVHIDRHPPFDEEGAEAYSVAIEEPTRTLSHELVSHGLMSCTPATGECWFVLVRTSAPSGAPLTMSGVSPEPLVFQPGAISGALLTAYNDGGDGPFASARWQLNLEREGPVEGAIPMLGPEPLELPGAFDPLPPEQAVVDWFAPLHFIRTHPDREQAMDHPWLAAWRTAYQANQVSDPLMHCEIGTQGGRDSWEIYAYEWSHCDVLGFWDASPKRYDLPAAHRGEYVNGEPILPPSYRDAPWDQDITWTSGHGYWRHQCYLNTRSCDDYDEPSCFGDPEKPASPGGDSETGCGTLDLCDHQAIFAFGSTFGPASQAERGVTCAERFDCARQADGEVSPYRSTSYSGALDGRGNPLCEDAAPGHANTALPFFGSTLPMDELLDACIADLLTLGDADQAVFSNRDCISLPLYLRSTYWTLADRMDEAHESVAVQMPADPARQRMFHRRVQQLLEILHFVARTGQQLDALSSLDVPVSPADEDALFDALEAGWRIVVHPRFSSFYRDFDEAVLADPDPREVQGGGDPQDIGLAANLLDAMAAYLQLTERRLETRWLQGDTSIDARTAHAVRYALAIESHALLMRRQTPDSAPWAQRFDQARGAFRSAFSRLSSAMARMTAGGNPLGIDDDLVPLYFEDVPSSEDPPEESTFASSGYLVGLAHGEVGAPGSGHVLTTLAQTADSEWRWLKDRQVAEHHAAADDIHRLDQLRRHYGGQLKEICGIKHWPDGSIVESSDYAQFLRDNLPTDAAGEPIYSQCAAVGLPPGCTDPSLCLTGALAEQLLNVQRARKEVEIRRSRLADIYRRFDHESHRCNELQAFGEARVALEDRHRDRMNHMRDKKLIWDSAAVALDAAASAASNWGTPGGYVAGGLALAAAAARITGMKIGVDMEKAQQDHMVDVLTMEMDFEVRDCHLAAHAHLIVASTATREIEQALIDASAAMTRMLTLRGDVERLVVDAEGAELAETATHVREVPDDRYLQRAIDAYTKRFRWARRLVYLAVRGLEFDLQRTPDQLDPGATETWRQRALTTTNLADLQGFLLELEQHTMTHTACGYNPTVHATIVPVCGYWTHVQTDGIDFSPPPCNGAEAARFVEWLMSPSNAHHDRFGNYAGQVLRFEFEPFIDEHDGTSAERIWSVAALIDHQGSYTSGRDGASLRLLHRNTFFMQWQHDECAGMSDAERAEHPECPPTPYQMGRLNPCRNLFVSAEDGVALPVGCGPEGYHEALLSPRMSDAHDAFTPGDNSEYLVGYSPNFSLAGRGLFGSYQLLFPWSTLVDPDGPDEPLKQHVNVDLLLELTLRFDVVSTTAPLGSSCN